MNKICVCGGTNPATNPEYINVADDVGKVLIKNNLELVWGGNGHGVLYKLYEEFKNSNKKSTLILPEKYHDDLKSMDINTKKDDVVNTNKVWERTVQMFANVNIVLFIPGGIGTAYEYWSALEFLRAEEFNYKVILFNYKNFYQHFINHSNFINENGFTKIGVGGSPYKVAAEDLVTVVNTIEQLDELLMKLANNK